MNKKKIKINYVDRMGRSRKLYPAALLANIYIYIYTIYNATRVFGLVVSCEEIILLDLKLNWN